MSLSKNGAAYWLSIPNEKRKQMHEGYHRVEVPTTIVEQDAQYYMARIEGQLARWEATLIPQFPVEKVKAHQEEILRATKDFLTSLRSALSPHRIDVS